MTGEEFEVMKRRVADADGATREAEIFCRLAERIEAGEADPDFKKFLDDCRQLWHPLSAVALAQNMRRYLAEGLRAEADIARKRFAQA